MQSLDHDLQRLVQQGKVSREEVTLLIIVRFEKGILKKSKIHEC